MNYSELSTVLNQSRTKFILWFMANLGGLIISYLASSIIFILHHHSGDLLPGKEAYLITGTVSLCISGVSYFKAREKHGETQLSTWFSILWPVFIMLVFGFLIAIGVKKPAAGDTEVFLLALILSMLCLFWSSIIWLHEQGMEIDSQKVPEKPQPDTALEQAASDLPKISEGE